MILHWDLQMAPWSCDSPLHLSMSAVQTLSVVKALVTVHKLAFITFLLEKQSPISLSFKACVPQSKNFSLNTKTIQLLAWAEETHEECRVRKPFLLLFCGRGKHKRCCRRHYEPEKFSVTFRKSDNDRNIQAIQEFPMQWEREELIFFFFKFCITFVLTFLTSLV